jgi:hypothetical protein
MNQEEEIPVEPKGLTGEEWGVGYLYKDPDYVEGSHPMDSDDVTWYHVWEKPKEPGKN